MILQTFREIAWPALILILAVLALALFGAVSLSYSLFAALAVGLIILGGVKLFLPGNPTIAIMLLIAGFVMFMLSSAVPLTIGQGLSFVGVDAS